MVNRNDCMTGKVNRMEGVIGANVTCYMVDRMVYEHKVHIVLVLVVEADFLHAALPQVQLGLHIQKLCAVVQLVRLCAMHVPVPLTL